MQKKFRRALKRNQRITEKCNKRKAKGRNKGSQTFFERKVQGHERRMEPEDCQTKIKSRATKTDFKEKARKRVER